MAKIQDKLLSFEKAKKNKKAIILPIIILLVLIGLGTLVIFKGREITDTLGITKSEEQKRIEQIEENLDSNKTYNKESGLIVPTFNTYSVANDRIKNIKIVGKNVEASSSGYKITFEFSTILNPMEVEFKTILIDGYETDVKLDPIYLTTTPQEVEVNIKKTKLDLLGINDFNYIGFFMKFTRDTAGLGVNKESYEFEKVHVLQETELNNEIRNKIYLEEIAGMKLYYYKTESDKENYYIYFVFEDMNKYNISHRIHINKLLINGTVYDIKMDTKLNTYSKDVKFITISKKDVSEINNINISFIIRNTDIDDDDKVVGIYYSNLHDVKIKES